MFSTEPWIEEILQMLASFGVVIETPADSRYQVNQHLLLFASANLLRPDIPCIVIEEDLFHTRKQQLLMRLKSQLGLNTKRIHGRQTKLKEITRKEAEEFVNQNHLMGFGGGKTFLGLFYKEQLVAVAVFSKILYMKYENPPYHSTELERYCSLADTTVVGGLDKFISHFEKHFQTDDLVTTIDLEWSEGRSYLNLGFEKVAKTKPLLFAVDSITYQRRVIENPAELKRGEYLIQNRGNLKLRKWLHKPSV